MEQENDPDLHNLLQEWKVPAEPASLRALVRKDRRRWWHILVHGYIRVPVPIACCIVAVIICGVWRLLAVPIAGCPTAILVSPRVERAHFPSNQPAAALNCAAKSTC